MSSTGLFSFVARMSEAICGSCRSPHERSDMRGLLMRRGLSRMSLRSCGLQAARLAAAAFGLHISGCVEDAMASGRTASWNDTAFPPGGAESFARDEETVRRGFWRKARRVARHLPFAEDLLAAYYCAFDRDTPLPVKAALIGALAYFVLPFDGIPDMLPLLGFADDAAVLATALRMVAGHMTVEHRAAAKRAIARGLAQEN